MNVSKEVLQVNLRVGERYFNGFFWFTYEGVGVGGGTYKFRNPNDRLVLMDTWCVNINFSDNKTSRQKAWV